MISHVRVFLTALINSWVQSYFEHLYTFRHILSENDAAVHALFGKLIHKPENQFSSEL
jgi:hypothetical protein